MIKLNEFKKYCVDTLCSNFKLSDDEKEVVNIKLLSNKVNIDDLKKNNKLNVINLLFLLNIEVDDYKKFNLIKSSRESTIFLIWRLCCSLCSFFNDFENVKKSVNHHTKIRRYINISKIDQNIKMIELEKEIIAIHRQYYSGKNIYNLKNENNDLIFKILDYEP